jgi:hypothetical protein
MRKGEKVDHIVPRLANYLNFLAYLVSVSYACPVFLMPAQCFLCPLFHIGYLAAENASGGSYAPVVLMPRL